MTLLPVARPLRAPDARAWRTFLFLVGVYAITVLTTPRWYPSYIFGTVFLTLALVWAPAAFGLARVRRSASRRAIAIGAAAIVFFAVVLGRAQEVQYYDHHYTEVDHFLQDGGPKARLQVRPQAARPPHRDRRLGRDLLRPVRLLRRQPRQLRPVHRRRRAERHLAPGLELPAVPPPDQRRRIRLPGPEPVHDGRGRARTSTRSTPGSRKTPRWNRSSKRKTSRRSPTTSSRSRAGSTPPAAAKKS